MVYRPKHHLTAPQGRINDPNGLTLEGDELHVYFQHDPGFPHEPKRTGWGHAAMAADGVWRHYPMALHPDRVYDDEGCWSGSAVSHQGAIRIFYTGNAGAQTQNIADAYGIGGPMGGTYRKRADNPALTIPPGYVEDFRDPHVSQAADGTWRMVVGARRENNTAAVLLYTSPDLDAWEFAGELEFIGLNYNTASAHMWECPNLLTMWDTVAEQPREVLVFCPQFPDSEECGYVVGRLDGLRFEVLRDFTPLDYGHEFYAPQLIPFGSGALMLGWMGLPGRDNVPTFEAEGWVHSLTLVRELSLIDASLNTSLHIPTHHDMLVERFELSGEEFAAELVDSEGNVGASVHWQPDGSGRGTLSLDVDGLVRWAECAGGTMVFVADGAAVELTAGTGEVAFSSAVFAPGGNDWASLRPAR